MSEPGCGGVHYPTVGLCKDCGQSLLAGEIHHCEYISDVWAVDKPSPFVKPDEMPPMPVLICGKRFDEILTALKELYTRKQGDYGRDEDPLANVRASGEWGVPPWVGAMMRLNDKVKRLQSLAKKGKLVNESAKDSLLDIGVYSILALILLEEEQK